MYIRIHSLCHDTQNWAQVHPASFLRCFYNFIGVHLWQIQLIGHDLERHTLLNTESLLPLMEEVWNNQDSS